MKYFNLFLCVALFVLLIMEAKRTFTNYKSHKEAKANVMATKNKIEVVKDYTIPVIIYSIIIALIVAAGAYNIYIKDYITAVMILGLAFFWMNFIIENICAKTYVFHESGFLFGDRQFKYRSVIKIEDEKKFARGYKVNVIGADEVYVTKNARVVLEERIKEYKNRKNK